MFFSALWGILSRKISLLGLFLNTLIADNKSFHRSEKIPQPIQMQLSKKQKTISQFSAPFLKSSSCFKQIAKKDDCHCLYISEITDYERRV